MDNRETARRRNEEQRQLYMIRRLEKAMLAAITRLEQQLRSFDEDVQRAEQAIVAQWLREHQGLAPERPPAWQTR